MKNNEYPDFIKGLVNLNIETNSATLEVYWNEVKILVDDVFTKQKDYGKTTIEELNLVKEIVETIIKCLPINVGDSYNRINDFIKAIRLIEILLNNNIEKVSISKAEMLIVSLLKISKIINNNEMKEISINMAKFIDNYDNNKYYPGMFVKEESNITPLKELMFND